MNRYSRILLLTAVLIMIMGVPLAGWAADGLSADLTARGDRFAVGDPLPFTLTVTHPPGYHVIMPEWDESWGDFYIAAVSSPITSSGSDGMETTSFAIDARLFAPGIFSTPPLALQVTDGSGHLLEVSVPPSEIEVTSVLVEGDTNLRDIKPQLQLPLAARWPWLLAGTSLIALAVVAGYTWRRRVRQPADDLRPHERAWVELDRVQSLALPERGDTKAHYTLIHDCMRHYMERTWQLPMVERTTTEIATSLRTAAIDQDLWQRFCYFLQQGDLVKFSDFTPSSVEAWQYLERARWFVRQTEHVHLPIVDSEDGTLRLQAEEEKER